MPRSFDEKIRDDTDDRRQETIRSARDRDRARQETRRKAVQTIHAQIAEHFTAVERLRSDRDRTFLPCLQFLRKCFRSIDPKLDKLEKPEVAFVVRLLQFSVDFARSAEAADAEKAFADLRHSFGMLKRVCA